MRTNFLFRYLIFISIFILGFCFFTKMTWLFLCISIFIMIALLLLKSGTLPISLQSLCFSLRKRLPYALDAAVYLPKATLASSGNRSGLIQTLKRAQQEAKEELEALLGVGEALAGINALVDSAKAAHKKGNEGFGIHAPALLIVIHGPSGTGKTHISNALAKLFYGFNAITSPKSFLLGKSKLQGFDPQSVLESSVGIPASGVIILDDADWMIASADRYADNPIDEIGPALAEFVADQPNNFVLVINGSKEQMEQMLGADEHRKWLRNFHVVQIYTEPLSDNDLLLILQDFLHQKGWVLSDEAEPNVQKLFRQLRGENSRAFDNAHAASHLADTLITLKAQQDILDTEHVITKNDIERMSEL